MDLARLGKILIFGGGFLALVGILLTISSKLPFLNKPPFLGKLPGDILIKREGFTFYFPLATSILLSILLTIILNLFLRR